MRISAKNLNLDIKAPLSKSVYHRELIVNFILGARGDFLNESPDDNDDIRATKACLRALEEDAETVILNCNESGSTLRFMIPVALAAKSDANRKLIFKTKGRLIDRPIEELSDCLKPFGVVISKDKENNEITVTGSIEPGRYVIDGSVSSQYISGLLMALSSFDKESSVEVTGGIASVHYIELTVAALAKYGINVERDGDTFKVPGKTSDIAVPDGNFEVEGDWSNGAFLLCLGSLIHGGSAKVSGLNMESVQGDREIMHFLRLAGITFIVEGDTIFVQDSRINSVRKLLEMDCSDIPDIVPYMAVLGAFRAEKTVLKGIKRLRIKESDRAKAITDMLTAIGANVTLEEDTITIEYINKVASDIVLTSSGDHRMAMAAVLCAAATGKDIELDNIDCLDKSFPEFRKVLLKEMTV